MDRVGYKCKISEGWGVGSDEGGANSRRSGASEGGDACHQRNHHENGAHRAHGAGKAEILGEGAEWGEGRGWSEMWVVWSRGGRARGPRELRIGLVKNACLHD